jgi:hypothetical protein
MAFGEIPIHEMALEFLGGYIQLDPDRVQRGHIIMKNRFMDGADLFLEVVHDSCTPLKGAEREKACGQLHRLAENRFTSPRLRERFCETAAMIRGSIPWSMRSWRTS